jgi:hypothetical protein
MLEQRIALFVDEYDHECYHESLNTLTLAEVYHERRSDILLHEKSQTGEVGGGRQTNYDKQTKN